MTKEIALDNLLEQIAQGQLISATMSSPIAKNRDENSPIRVVMRRVALKARTLYQISRHFPKKVLHSNATFQEGAEFIKENLPLIFRQGVFETHTASYHLLVNRHRQVNIIKKAARNPLQTFVHNRKKKYFLEEGTPIPYLVALGIMNDAGKVMAKKYDKFRQVNKFLEIINDVIKHLPEERIIEIIDFGCGKAYLTFALYHFLHVVAKREVHMVGLDLKQDVIEASRALAKSLGYEGLEFIVGNITHFQPKGDVDLVIALHACDTATDAAIEQGVRWGAKVLLCVPCCQHELLSQIKSPPLNSLMQYGILKERFSALATDAARAEILTILGYGVEILEFIDMEHTPKNLLLRAVKILSKSKEKQAEERYRIFKESLNIKPFLDFLTR